MKALLCFIAWAVAAQTSVFEVASVRPSAGPGAEGSAQRPIATSPAGVTARWATLRDCIEWAYRVRTYQVVGPDWIDSEKYDIIAKAAAPVSADRLRQMMRSLLADRFRLKVHREERQMPVYALAPGHGGVKLHASTADMSGMRKLPGGGLRLEFRRTTMADLAAFLSTLAAIDRPVRDASGLAAAYDFQLDLHDVAGPWKSDAERAAAPSFSTILQEQLGLKMESRKDPVEAIVVDHIERPSPN